MKILFLGPQGSGKSTQAKLAAEKLSLPYIEMGSLLREIAQGNDTKAGEIRQALETGDLVPDYITIETLQKRLNKPDCQSGFVLDGYPRNYAQLEGLPPNIDRVFYFTIPDEEAVKRLIERGRHDDTLKVITRRLEVYHRDSEPLVTYFTEQGILEEIDANRNIEEIKIDMIRRLENENSQKQ